MLLMGPRGESGCHRRVGGISTSRPPELGPSADRHGSLEEGEKLEDSQTGQYPFSFHHLSGSFQASPFQQTDFPAHRVSVINAPPPPPQQQSLLSEPTLGILFKPNCQPATSAAAPTVMCEQTWALHLIQSWRPPARL